MPNGGHASFGGRERQSSALTRWVEPIASALWTLFVLISAVVALVWSCGIGDATLGRWVQHPDLLRALLWLSQHLDFAWITLAAANCYLNLASQGGLGTARRWGLAIVLAVFALAWLSTWMGFPLGPIQYGHTLGPRFGPVPLGLPLFWFTVIIGARQGLLRFFPRWSHAEIALGTGLLALLTDASLEPLAAGLRGFWFWRSGSPAQPPVFDAPLTGYFVWGMTAALLAFGFREKNVVTATRTQSWQPAATLAIFHAVFLAAHLGRWVRD